MLGNKVKMSSRKISLTAVQFKPLPRNPDLALKKLLPLVEAGSKISDLVVLPELASTNYLFDSVDDISPFAETKGGLFLQSLQKANIGKSHIVAGFIENDNNVFYNSAYIIDSENNYSVYRKTLLYTSDESWATPGNIPYPIFQINGFSVTVGICMDLNDDNFTNFCEANYIDIVALPVNWLNQEEDVRPYWRYRLGYDCLLIAANKYGEENDISFRGYSTIMYSNYILAEMGEIGDGLITFDYEE
jgi:predicted amidohydrolase